MNIKVRVCRRPDTNRRLAYETHTGVFRDFSGHDDEYLLLEKDGAASLNVIGLRYYFIDTIDLGTGATHHFGKSDSTQAKAKEYLLQAKELKERSESQHHDHQRMESIW